MTEDSAWIDHHVKTNIVTSSYESESRLVNDNNSNDKTK